MDERTLNPEGKNRLHTALFGTSLGGIEATGEVYPLGAFLLIGAMIDMLAGLTHAPERDNDRQQGARFAAFVDTYFDGRYRAGGMGHKMWDGLRCKPLHNFSVNGILLADSQSEKAMHLRVHEDNVVLHWPDFLDDYRAALERYWSQLQVDPDLRENAARRCERYPPMMVTKIVYDGLPPPMTSPPTFGGVASAYGGPPVEPNPD